MDEYDEINYIISYNFDKHFVFILKQIPGGLYSLFWKYSNLIYTNHVTDDHSLIV